MTTRQRKAAQRNVQKAQKAARSKKTISNLPSKVRSDLGREGAKAARRGGRAGHSYEERTRTELYEQAKKAGIAGRSKMGKSDLIRALRRS
jgi:hypothetical protein